MKYYFRKIKKFSSAQETMQRAQKIEKNKIKTLSPSISLNFKETFTHFHLLTKSKVLCHTFFPVLVWDPHLKKRTTRVNFFTHRDLQEHIRYAYFSYGDILRRKIEKSGQNRFFGKNYTFSWETRRILTLSYRTHLSLSIIHYVYVSENN